MVCLVCERCVIGVMSTGRGELLGGFVSNAECLTGSSSQKEISAAEVCLILSSDCINLSHDTFQLSQDPDSGVRKIFGVRFQNQGPRSRSPLSPSQRSST